jgi:hypothetical protein
MNRWTQYIIAGAVSSALLFCACSNGLLANGGVSETTNGVTANVVYPDGSPCANAQVRLRLQDYVVDFPESTLTAAKTGIDSTTDTKGRLHLKEVGPGRYFIEVDDGAGNALALKVVVSEKDSLINLGTDTIHAAGTVIGTIINAPPGQFYVQVRGLEHIAFVNKEGGGFRFSGLPPGRFAFRIVSNRPDSMATDLDSVTVLSNAVSDIGMVWLQNYSRRIVLNTTATGADVSETVAHFPVLVRLTPATFDFSQARADGVGIGFCKSNGTSLDFEIERWDSAGNKAEIWVKVDTVFGNNGTQNIRMVWGNPAIVSSVNKYRVFDTADGFQGVWHMNEPGAAACLDATGNHYDGMPYGMTPSSSSAGAIGQAQQFDGTSSYIRMNGTAQSHLDIGENGVYTISAWVYSDTADLVPHLIAGKGHEQYYVKMMLNDVLKTLYWENVEYHGLVGWQITESPATAKTWKHIVGVRNGTNQLMYVDGELADSTTRSIAGSIARNTGEDFSIGAYLRDITYLTPEGYCYFKGAIDEVRICTRAYDAAWIKLSFMNQKATDALVRFQ